MMTSDVEAGTTWSRSSRSYGTIPGFDLNRFSNAVAVWSLVVFWLWIAFYWMLQYAPMPMIHEPGSSNNEYKYTSVVIDSIKKAMCPLDKGGSPISYCVWYYPAFICFTIVALLVRRQKFRPRLPRNRLAGDMDFVLFSYIAVGIPLLIFFCFYMYKKWPSRKEEWTDAKWVEYQATTWANRVGFVGFWALTFFMIPATRHGPVLAVLGWHPYHACTIHMFCGWLSYWTSMIHFLCYIIKYGAGEYPMSREEEHMELTGGWKGYQFIFPPSMCFTWNGKNGGQVNATTGEVMLDDDLNPMAPLGYRDCGKMLAGFYGTIGIIAFTVLVVTSMLVVRRYRYQVFYFSHIICAPVFLLFVSMHWRLTYQYFWPSLFYYFATQAPFLLQHNRKTINNYGLRVTGVMDIPCRQSPKPKEGAPVEAHSAPVDQRNIIQRIFSPSSIDWLDEKVNRVGPQAKSIEHCVSFDFEVTESGFEQFYPGMYGNIWCPDASMKSHPFSVTHVPGRTDQLRIIFRVFGRWTDLLARSLIQLPCPGHQQEYLPIPKIMMDGWHGPDHLVGSALNHDKVIIVTAGIGITAFLSMFTEMIELLCFKEDGMFIKMDEIQGAPITKEFSLQWTCRDENLIKYITDEYFQPLIEKAERKGRDSGDDDGAKCSRCSIHIHRTGPAGQKTIKPSSLWMSFRDKTERGIAEIDFGLLGTFGTPWKPYRFSFGKFDSLMEHIPSIIMFVLILWLSYLLTIEIHFSLIYNPFGITQATEYFLRIFGILPTLFVAFGVGWIGHVLVDWSENVSVHNKNTRTEKTSGDGSANNNGYTEKTCDDGSADNNGYNEKTCDDGSVDSNGYDVFPKFTKSLIQPEENESGKGDGDICLKDEMISLTSTAGRPPFNELVEAGDTLPVSTGIFLCGPEKMIESCKKAAGLNCMIAAERLQMFAKGNKFVFYEEKFEW